MKIYVFGSHYRGDHIACQVAEYLAGEHDIVYGFDPTDLIYENDVLIMDAVKGINRVKIFYNVTDLDDSNICSLHDFDLCYFLQLADNLGFQMKVTIIGLPMKGELQDILEGVNSSLQELKELPSLP